MNNILDYDDFLFEKNKEYLIKNSDKTRLSKIKNIKVVFDNAFFKNKLFNIKFESIDKNSYSGHSWTQTIQVLEFDKDATSKKDLKKALNGNLKIHCDCPDFLYKGYQYIGTKNEYSIHPENKSPIIRNPEEEGTVCKHLLAVLNNLDKNINKIHGEING